MALLLSTFVGAVIALVADALDVQELDLENSSVLRQRMALGGFAGEQGSGFPPVLPFLGWLLLQLGSVLSVLVFAFGEECGWRGYLLPKLLPTGIWPMLLLSGVIWTAWHAPLILLRDFAAHCALFLVGRALPQVVVISWLRLASGSVWAAVVFHASSVMIFTGVAALSESGSALNPAVSLMGRDLPLNWFVMAAVAVLLAVTGRLRARPGDPALSEAAQR
ncbi:membrane protease YdiL (CAAX protease family) [Saccharopolyspora lacisalsi]|uniref:Membrane protease YdiL (CAAX protease family) n=1 Tax=Halosaccharopolyspora lacisalsi TaxID=1000566 RepID=A0A839DV16_9PSEU|nr:CPBP family intramembrane glutamic endopeptidase [Halosaccharopolyspora lacisalsi]MBA8824609.1 membrane protease YdiL (CAAX protease family) [Halosaccharopolyspora lacisalsi]